MICSGQVFSDAESGYFTGIFCGTRWAIQVVKQMQIVAMAFALGVPAVLHSRVFRDNKETGIVFN